MPISTMKKLTVLAVAGDADAVVRKLMKLRCVEIRSTEVGEGSLLTSHFDSDGQRAESEARLRKIREALPHLNRYTMRKKRLGGGRHRIDKDEFVSSGRAEAAWKTVQRTLDVCGQMDAIHAEIARVRSAQESVLPWIDFDAPLDFEGSLHTVAFLGSFPSGVTSSVAEAELEALGAYCETVSAEKNALYVSVFCHKQDEDAVNRYLASRGFLKTAFREQGGSASAIYEQNETKLSSLSNDYLKAEEQLRTLAEELDDVEILCDVEQTNANAARHLKKLATTRSCAILEGWMPQFTRDAVVDALDRFECAYDISDPTEEDEPPVLLRNNRFAASFEWVIGMYAYPKYGAFDPTLIMSIFYFILFGLMFADVGYGLLLVLGCFGGVRLLRPRAGLRRMMYMFGYCGIASIVMGLIFGGWFGDLPTAVMSNMLGLPIDRGVGHFFGSGLWFNPLDDPMTFLILSLGMGGIHLIAGMVIKFVVLCKEGKTMEALATVATYWVLFAGLLLLVLGMLGEQLAILSTVGTVLSILGALLILVFNGYGRKSVFSRIMGGLGGLYGLINYASDLLSYSRILALGLVAGVIAKVINLITMLGATGGVGFVFMLIILLVGHGLNLAINVLGTFVHTSRLQYIEFFGKFYEDGGTPFVPAEEADQYTEAV